MARLLVTLLGTTFAMVTIAAGCGSSEGDSNFGNGTSSGNGASGGDGTGFGPGSSGSATPPAPPCEGLQCQQVACPGGGTTSLSGKVYDPSGTLPLYNAVVYVPNAELAPFVEGISCDRCGTTPSGKPITTALTDATGSFTLKNVPVGVDVPLVVQLGRWRRKVTIPAANVTQCTDAKLDATMTRLPRVKAEGDIPKIAITTGGADSLECFMRKLLGNQNDEFSNPDGAGRIHLYWGEQKDSGGTNGAKIDGATPKADTLWEDPAKLSKYDIVILSCEGSENNTTKSTAARANLLNYLNGGGRVFSSHFHYTWYKNGTNPLPSTATWTGANLGGNRDLSVDTSFAKGVAFSTWLDTVSATTAPGSATLAATNLKNDVTTVPAAGTAPDTSRRWLYASQGAAQEAKFYSFNTPLGSAADAQCGRGVFTDVHVSAGAGLDTPGGTFPSTTCHTTGFTPQEKALVFLMMDLASCIQDDSKAPEPPPSDPGVH